ncbi:MAG TPA: rhodanese-like domain-containing protein [Symbiobacteriaceae bacterium]|nr:rhodanese-like domain-containing protein [Symbiobacteriaceae bacterium]
MLSWLRSRLFVVASLLVIVFALTGCGGAKEEPKAAAAAPAAAAPAPTCPECPKVDKAAVLKEAAVGYFNTLPPTTHMIDAKDLKPKYDAKDASIFLLDIRKPEDFKAGHVEGFTNMAMGTIGANIDKLPKDKQIVVACYSGQTAGQTVAALRLAGYNAIALKGGFPSLQPAGFAVVK